MSQPSMLTPKDAGTGWSNDGGNWGFQITRRVSDGVRLVCKTFGSNNPDAFSLISHKKGNGLDDHLKWSNSSEVWTIKHATTVSREGITYQRFAIFSERERRYLMLCDRENDRARNNEELCLYDAVVYPSR